MPGGFVLPLNGTKEQEVFSTLFITASFSTVILNLSSTDYMYDPDGYANVVIKLNVSSKESAI